MQQLNISISITNLSKEDAQSVINAVTDRLKEDDLMRLNANILSQYSEEMAVQSLELREK